MAFLEETGLIVPGSCSYVTVLECDTYMLENGYSAWGDQEDETKEATLRQAARYLDGHYRSRWKGQKTDPINQPMEWPRIGVKVAEYIQLPYANPSYDPEVYGYLGVDVIPQRLKEAQCELAYRALSGQLAADGDISIKREKLDVIETEYATGVVKGKVAYQVVDQLLSDLICSSSSIDISRS